MTNKKSAARMTCMSERRIITELQAQAVEMGDDIITLLCAKALCGNSAAWADAVEFAASLADVLSDMDAAS